MNYIGSKQSLLGFIEEVYEGVAEGDEAVFCDLFAGTGAVGRRFKARGMRVIANDLQHYAYVLNRAYVGIDGPPAFAKLLGAFGAAGGAEEPAAAALRLLDDLPATPGFIAAHYGPDGDRQYFSRENAGKADAVRVTAEQWRRDGLLSEDEYYYVLCALLEAADGVANTASVYGAYLKRFKASALRPLRLRPLALPPPVPGCEVYREDANALIERLRCDVLYLDPPYNQRQYGANYHVLETIARYDSPAVSGTSGMRSYPRSRYCRPREVLSAFRDLIRRARARHILVSYNDEGLMSHAEIREVLAARGRPVTFQKRYSRYKADRRRAYRRDATTEYLHYVRVTRP